MGDDILAAAMDAVVPPPAPALLDGDVFVAGGDALVAAPGTAIGATLQARMQQMLHSRRSNVLEIQRQHQTERGKMQKIVDGLQTIINEQQAQLEAVRQRGEEMHGKWLGAIGKLEALAVLLGPDGIDAAFAHASNEEAMRQLRITLARARTDALRTVEEERKQSDDALEAERARTAAARTALTSERAAAAKAAKAAAEAAAQARSAARTLKRTAEESALEAEGLKAHLELGKVELEQQRQQSKNLQQRLVDIQEELREQKAELSRTTAKLETARLNEEATRAAADAADEQRRVAQVALKKTTDTVVSLTKKYSQMQTDFATRMDEHSFNELTKGMREKLKTAQKELQAQASATAAADQRAAAAASGMAAAQKQHEELTAQLKTVQASAERARRVNDQIQSVKRQRLTVHGNARRNVDVKALRTILSEFEGEGAGGAGAGAGPGPASMA